MIDPGGHARLAVLSPPWAVRRKYAPAMILTETITGFYAPMMNAFSFGVVATEVRPVYLAAYSVEDGEMDNLSSAQGFCGGASVW